MENYQAIFARTEKKYRLNKAQASDIMKELLKQMVTDERGITTVISVYLDTADDLLIRRSLEKPAYKEKLRIRCYGVPRDASDVFLELKKKFNGRVYKRRVSMQLCDAREYIRTGEHGMEDSQIMRELDYSMKQYQAVPKACIIYDRLALFGRDDPDLRITFDFNLRGRDFDLDPAMGDWGEPILPEQESIMEIKTNGGMPLWLCRLLSSRRIYPVSFSKYGTFYNMKKTEKEYEKCLKA